ncbi:MAG TPA: hydratase [Propylenella sp.]|nr:hydratase [Propylenella sp.]
MFITDDDADALAGRILAAGDRASPIAPITGDRPDFDLAAAYAVSARVTRRRIGRGERPVGWKIGFTNRTIWDEYGVHAPIWGPMYDTTVATIDADAGPASCPLRGLSEPRLEPEIALRIASPPHPEMDERDLLACVDGVAHGFEIVQSIFPGWRFRAADTVAAFALHGRYFRGPLVPVAVADQEHWLAALQKFEIALFRDGTAIDRGAAANVLGGPLSAFGHLVRGLAEYPMGRGIEPGDLVTTGTVTRAFPVAPGELWHTEIFRLPTPGLAISFT